MILETTIEQPLKVGMIGGGVNSAIGKVHQIAMRMDRQFELVAGCFSRDLRNNQRSAAEYGVSVDRVYDSDQALLDSEASHLDAVVIVTPIQTHTGQIFKALDRGLRVISDKPLVGDTEDFDAIERRVANEHAEVYCIFNYTGYPIVREMKRLVEAGLIGDVFKVMAEMPQDSYIRLKNQGRVDVIQDWRLRDGRIGCVTLDLFVHLHSLVNFVCGKHPRSVNAWSRSISGVAPGLADEVDAVIHYDDQMVVNAWYGKAALGYRNGLRIRVFGTRGSLQWHQEEPEILIIADANGNRMFADRLTMGSSVAAESRYQRFKIGHPSGFIEAFANYYTDIADTIKMCKPSPYVLPLSVVGEGLRLARAIHVSSANREEVILT